MFVVNSNEAPRGFYAVSKPSSSSVGNVCAHCDWRSECNSGKADFEDPNNRCMSEPVISRLSGKEISRRDGQSVIFKRAI